MISLKDEIFMTKKEIESAKEELELLDPSNPNNRFKIPNIKSEIRILERKLEQLELRLSESEEIKNEVAIPSLIPNNNLIANNEEKKEPLTKPKVKALINTKKTNK